jgi:hypothetical protein
MHTDIETERHSEVILFAGFHPEIDAVIVLGIFGTPFSYWHEQAESEGIQFSVSRFRTLPPSVSQFIEAGRTLANVRQYGRRLSSNRFHRQFPGGGSAGTVGAMGVGMILVHNPVEGIE